MVGGELIPTQAAATQDLQRISISFGPMTIMIIVSINSLSCISIIILFFFFFSSCSLIMIILMIKKYKVLYIRLTTTSHDPHVVQCIIRPSIPFTHPTTATTTTVWIGKGEREGGRVWHNGGLISMCPCHSLSSQWRRRRRRWRWGWREKTRKPFWKELLLSVPFLLVDGSLVFS